MLLINIWIQEVIHKLISLKDPTLWLSKQNLFVWESAKLTQPMISVNYKYSLFAQPMAGWETCLNTVIIFALPVSVREKAHFTINVYQAWFEQA